VDFNRFFYKRISTLNMNDHGVLYIFLFGEDRSIYLEGKIIIYMMGNDEKNMLKTRDCGAQVSTP